MQCEVCEGRVAPAAEHAGWTRCRRCSHLQRAAHDPGTTRSHPWGGNQWLDRLRLGLVRRKLLRELQGGRPARILEVGYGRGNLLVSLARAGHDVHGVERHMLEREAHPDLARVATLYRGGVEEVDLPRDHFDLVYGIHVIEHVMDARRMLQVLRAALKPHGTIFLHTPDGRSAGISLFRGHWWNFEDPTHIRFFSRQSMHRLIQDVGLSVPRIRRPWSDSLLVEPMSVVRRWLRDGGGDGVMTSRRRLALGLGLLPMTGAARALWWPLRPTLEVVTRKGLGEWRTGRG